MNFKTGAFGAGVLALALFTAACGDQKNHTHAVSLNDPTAAAPHLPIYQLTQKHLNIIKDAIKEEKEIFGVTCVLDESDDSAKKFFENYLRNFRIHGEAEKLITAMLKDDRLFANEMRNFAGTPEALGECKTETHTAPQLSSPQL